MLLPDVIGPISSKGNPPDGIITEIKSKHNVIDPIQSKIVIPTASSSYSNYAVSTVIFWNAPNWHTKGEKGSYLQLQFPRRKIYLTGYSIKGISDSDRCYQKTWRVEGFNHDEKNCKEKWTFLARNYANETNFCGCTAGCTTTAISTYQIPMPSKGFEYIRWTIEETSNSENHRFVSSGIEVYGTLLKSNFCSKKVCRTYASRSFSVLALVLINVS